MEERNNKEGLTRKEFLSRLSLAALTAFLFVISSGKDSSAGNDMGTTNVCYTNTACYGNCYTNCYSDCHGNRSWR